MLDVNLIELYIDVSWLVRDLSILDLDSDDFVILQDSVTLQANLESLLSLESNNFIISKKEFLKDYILPYKYTLSLREIILKKYDKKYITIKEFSRRYGKRILKKFKHLENERVNPSFVKSTKSLKKLTLEEILKLGGKNV